MCMQKTLGIHTKKAKNMHTNTWWGSRWDCSSSSSSSVQLSSFNAPPLITSARRRGEQLLRRLIYGGSRRLRADPFGSQHGDSGQLASKPASGLRTGQGLLQMRGKKECGGGGGGGRGVASRLTPRPNAFRSTGGRRRPPSCASPYLLRESYLRSGVPLGRSITSQSRQLAPRMRPPRRSAEETSARTLFQLPPCSGTRCSESFTQKFLTLLFFFFFGATVRRTVALASAATQPREHVPFISPTYIS